MEELNELWKFYADEINAEDFKKIKQLESEIAALKGLIKKENDFQKNNE